ncbi:G-type lectin S-receptor-like serine/threonine-protein kinase At4g27290 [Lactuca sativa]|uniref:G-type lectin S-receptor-like serine/threonine-protein kinase At4g27290 n=1 Tax=Lactuca sativa TaxID=4236 RepID=UPI001C692A9F|nr:G-type lectin S-receptor-like serine/threonine-protein kinase At4g27290 [Lactuca sativa]
MEVYPMLLLFSSTIFFFLSSSAAVDTISANQPIKDGKTIVSDGKMYELGFFSPGKSTNRYLGIWYKKISTGTVVWVANRETPISDTSGGFEVDRQGNLLIRSGSNTVIWSSNTPASVRNASPVAQLLDSGNLVVWDESSTKENPIWQSFDYPGNTLLPGMKLGKDLVKEREWSITTWKSPDDPSIGLYKLRLDANGYPQVFVGEGQVDNFRLAPWNGVGFRGIPVENTNPIYSVEFVVNQKEIYYRYELIGSVFQRIIVMSDGILLHMSWINRTQQWVVYGSIAVDSCSQYGRCGPYGSCFIKTYPPCSCMEGFEVKDPEEWNVGDWSSGCQRETPLDSGSSTAGDDFQKVSGMKFPDTRRSWFNVSMSLGECEMACRSNCSCTAYANLDIRNGGSGCLLWFDELMDMGEHDDPQELYIRLATSKLAGQSSFDQKNGVLTIVLCVSSAALLLCAVVYVYRKKKKMPHKQRRENAHILNYEDDTGFQMENLDELPFFSRHKIAKATNNFSSDYNL